MANNNNPRPVVRVRAEAVVLPKAGTDNGKHHVVFIGPWAFPLSSFKENEWYLLSLSHVPINDADRAWDCVRNHKTTKKRRIKTNYSRMVF